MLLEQTGGKWTSDVQTFQGTDSGGQPIFPWQPNETTWKNQTSPTTTESNAVVRSVIVSQNGSVVVIKTTTPSVEIVDHIRFDVDPVRLTSNCSLATHLPIQI